MTARLRKGVLAKGLPGNAEGAPAAQEEGGAWTGPERCTQRHEAQNDTAFGGKCKLLQDCRMSWKVRLRSEQKVLR